MALSGGHRFGVKHDDVFPGGAYAVSEVEQAKDWNQSTDANFVQAKDEKGTGLPTWTVTVLDNDPKVKGKNKSTVVKIDAERQPVLPPIPDGMPEGLPMVPVAFEGLTVTVYKDRDSGRITHSLRASGVAKPSTAADDMATAAANGNGGKAASSSSSASARTSDSEG